MGAGEENIMTSSGLVPRRTALKVGAGVVVLPLLAGVFGAMSPAFSQQSPPESEKAKQIVALVDKAAALVDSKGKSAFPEFRKTGSEWWIGDTYLFAGDMKGMSVFNAAFPKLEGTDIGGLKDSNGKLIGVELMKAAESKGAGWVNYMWPKPGQSQSSQKWSYVKAVKIDGTPGYVGAGFYP
jgi:methyl-accepting chemotaxis protein